MKPKIDMHKLLWEGGWEGRDRELILTAVCGYEADFELDWWQSWYIRKHPHLAFLAANKSRRVGWSFITAGDGLLNAMDPQKKRYTKQFVSYSLEDAKEKIKTAREFYESIPEVLRPKKLVRASQTYLEFLDKDGKSTSRLVSWPCKGPRGKGGDISLDEMAFYGIKAEEVYTAAMGVIARGGTIEIGSTPFGQSGRFYEILSDRHKYRKYKAIEVPWYYSSALCMDVVGAAKMAREYDDEKMVRTFGTEKLQEIFESMPLPDFLQEYNLDFRDEKAAFITLEMIQACTPVGDDEIEYFRTLDDLILNYNPEKHGTLYAGYDVGRVTDTSELIVMGYHPDAKMKTVVGVITYRGLEFDKQEHELNRFMTDLPVHRLCIDSTGLGMHLAENMKRRKGARVEEVQFNAEVKEDLAQSGYLGFQRMEYLLPPDRDLQKHIHSIRRTTTSAGNIRYDNDRSEGHHADKAWAFFLADHAVSGAKAQSSNFYTQFKAKKAEGKVSSFSQAQVLNRMRQRAMGG